MFCHICQNALKRLANEYRREENGVIHLFHHRQISDLQTAVDDGCRICTVFWSSFTPSEKNVLLKSDAKFAAKQLQPPNDSDVNVGDIDEEGRKRDQRHEATSMMMNPDFYRHPPGYRDCSIHLGWDRANIVGRHHLTNFVLQPMPADQPGKDGCVQLSSNTGAAENWPVVEQWLENCLTSHKRCNTLQNSSWYPSRLLDLEYHDDAVRLVESKADACQGKYMTLSHRWGGANPISLTRASYSAMRSSILLASLPAAFQDAITACRRLKVRYLWIDSLCIMQDRDDLSDWVKEAVTMDKVYSHSYLNISALAAADSSKRIFVARDPGAMTDACISSLLDDTKPMLELGTELKNYKVLDREFWSTELTSMPLNLRGWVLQERLLSPRVLHFGPRQLLWECHELDASETFPAGHTHCHDSRFKDSSLERYVPLSSSGSEDEDTRQAAYALWTNIVYEYTGCSITNAGDKLVALAGIAKMLTPLANDEYTVGLWKSHLIYQLLWTAGKKQFGSKVLPGELFCRPSVYRAPSFSWASTEGRVWLYDRREGNVSMAEVVDVSLQFLGDNPYSFVQSGYLVLRCKLRQVSLTRKFSPYHKPYGMVLKGVEQRTRQQSADIEDGIVRPSVALDEEEEYFEPAGRQDLYAAPIVTGDRYWGTLMLLLQLVDSARGMYRRVGRVACETAYTREALEESEIDGGRLPCVAFDASWHTIRII